MKLEIKSVKDKGTNNERLVLQVIETCNIGNYFVFSAKKLNEEILTETVKNNFWFPDKILKRDDLAILYTRKGSESFKENSSGSKSHFFYRGLESSIYDGNTFALVIEVENWQVEK
jgi:hypothetical protein